MMFEIFTYQIKQQAHHKLLLTTISFVKNNYIIQKNEKSSTAFHFCKSIKCFLKRTARFSYFTLVDIY